MSDFYLVYFLLDLSFVFACYSVVKNEGYKSSLFFFFVNVAVIFYTPVLYFEHFGGTSYGRFRPATLDEFAWIGTFMMLVVAATAWWTNKIPVQAPVPPKRPQIPAFVGGAYIAVIVAALLAYVFVYSDAFPLISLVGGGAMVERPDGSGAAPHYYSVSTLMHFVVPAFYFYMGDMGYRRAWRILLFVTTCFFLLVGGNKGTLAYFFLFIWAFELKFRVNWKVVSLAIVVVFFYVWFKGELHTRWSTVGYAAFSPMRRFFVTQGSMFIHRLDMLNAGFDFAAQKEEIKILVCKRVYLDYCSAPTYFWGDWIIEYGWAISTTLNLVVVGTLGYFGAMINKIKVPSNTVKWGLTAIISLLTLAQLDRFSSVRILAIALNGLILFIVASSRSPIDVAAPDR